jgi:single-stranded DNA-binding protein
LYEEPKGAKKKMLGLNSIQIIGNLGGTPDMKFLNDGRSQVVNFSVAVNERCPATIRKSG